MYKYAGVDTGADALTGFAQEGYKSTAAQDVPKEISPLDIALKQLRGDASYVSPSTPALQDVLNLLACLVRQTLSSVCFPHLHHSSCMSSCTGGWGCSMCVSGTDGSHAVEARQGGNTEC